MKYPGFYFSKQSYQHVSTIDIDNAWAYLEKGNLRTAGGYARAFIKSNKEELAERKKVFSGTLKDPYDTYDILANVQKKYNLKSIFFFLLADYGRNDKNVPSSSKKLQALIKSIDKYAEIGIHGSFASNNNPNKLKKEISRLSRILNKQIVKSRQHFLILNFPGIYRNLLAKGITEDYTMGFAQEIGFRAGICTSYYWYDLQKEEETQLMIHPFAIMDATLNFYMQVSPDKVIEKVKPIIDEVKKVEGTFMSLWHNESLSEKGKWKAWRNVYEEIVKAAQ